MEKRLDMIEKGDFRAEPLTEVLSLEDDESDTMRAVFNTAGQLEAVKVGKKVPMPMTTEELRSRISLLGRSWAMAGSLHTHRHYLRDATPALFDKYVGYLLGKFVLGLVTVGPPGSPVAAPSWLAVLHYDFEVRKAAMNNLLSGATMAEAMQKAMDDPVVRERSFTTPLALAHLKRGAPSTEVSADRPTKKQRQQTAAAEKKRAAEQTGGQGGGQVGQVGGKGDKGKGKNGKGKGAGKVDSRCATKTPDGKPICYSYNTRGGGCTRPKCIFEHVCGICYTPGHGAYNCPQGGKHQ